MSEGERRGPYDYTKGSIGWGIFRIAFPTFGEQIIWRLDALAELFWVGRLGPEYLAAMSLGFLVILLIRGVGFGIRVAGQALVAQRVGAGDNEGAALMVGQILSLLAMILAPIVILGIWLSPRIIALFTSDPRILQLGTGYLRAGFAVLFFIEGQLTLAQIFRGSGEPSFSVTGMIVSTAVSVAAMPLFIFGAWGIPALGLPGAFLGTGLGKAAGTIVLSRFITSGRSRLHLRREHLRPRRELLIRIAGLSWPVTVQSLLERGANLVILRVLSIFGAYALAAWGLGNRVILTVRIPGMGIHSAVRTMVGQNIGAGLPERAQKSVWLSLWAVALFVGATSIALYFAADAVVRFFGMQGEAARIGAMCLRFLSVGVPFDACRRVLAGAFQGASNPKPPMLAVAAARWGVQIPGAYLAGVVLGMGGAGVWGAVSGSQIFGSCVMITLFWLGFWKRRLHEVAASPRAVGKTA